MTTSFSFFIMCLVGLLGFAISFASIPWIKRLAFRLEFISRPGGHSSHKRAIPLLGGVAIYLSFAVAFLIFFLGVLIQGDFDREPSIGQMLSLFIGTTWITILGIIDDKISLSWKQKVLGQLVGIAILIIGGHTINAATLPIMGGVTFGWWTGIPLFVVVVLTITNAINLIDGIDGLAGGICFFASLTMGIIGIYKGDTFGAVVGFAVAGGILGFLRYNFPPASIFMGDGGSLMLGFLLGALATSNAAPEAGQRSGTMVMLIAPFFPFGIALLDVTLAIFRRWLSGQKIFFPDTNHLHHKLMQTVGSPRAVVSILYAFSALLSAMTLTFVLGPQDRFFTLYMIMSGLVLMALMVMVLRLYLADEGLPRILNNRPHIKFLTSYITFMSRRIRRAQSVDELFLLLETGVRDLDFDSVRLFQDGRTLRYWSNKKKRHADATRQTYVTSFDRLNLGVEIVVPQHDSQSYQRHLKLTWDEFLKELNERLIEYSEAVSKACHTPHRCTSLENL